MAHVLDAPEARLHQRVREVGGHDIVDDAGDSVFPAQAFIEIFQHRSPVFVVDTETAEFQGPNRPFRQSVRPGVPAASGSGVAGP